MKRFLFNDFLKRYKEDIRIDSNDEYRRVTVRLYNKGVCLRDKVNGSEIAAEKMFLVRAGQFIMSRIDARNGAFGIIPEELDGAVITNDFLAFDVEQTIININYFKSFVQTQAFMDACIKGSTGTTNRKRLKEELFLDFSIDLPSIENQLISVDKLKIIRSKLIKINEEISLQNQWIESLKLSLLQETVQGKLVPQNHDDEPASELLKRINEEKQRLIIDGKIKKEKPLPSISMDEVLFELPNGWEWVRLGDVASIKGGKRLPLGHNLTSEQHSRIYIRVTDMKNDTIDDSDLRYLFDDTYEKIKEYIIEKDDLYIVIVGSTIGKVGRIPERFHQMNLTENAARIIVHCINKNYLLYILKSGFMQNQFVEKTNQLGQPKLALIRLKNSLLPLPPLEEQQNIVDKLDRIMQNCNFLESSVLDSKKDSEMLMQSALQGALI